MQPLDAVFYRNGNVKVKLRTMNLPSENVPAHTNEQAASNNHASPALNNLASPTIISDFLLHASCPLEIINRSLDKYGVCVLPEFFKGSDLEAIIAEYQFLMRVMSEHPHCYRYPTQTIIEVHPEAVTKSLEYPAMNWTTNSYINLCPRLVNFASSELVRRVSAHRYGDEPFFLPVRWLVMDSRESPAGMDSAPYYLHYDRVRFLKFFVYLNDVDAGGGPFEILVGSDNLRADNEKIRQSYISSGRDWREMNNEYVSETKPVSIQEKAGTVIIFDSNVPHRQGVMEAGRSRQVICLETQRLSDQKFAAKFTPQWIG